MMMIIIIKWRKNSYLVLLVVVGLSQRKPPQATLLLECSTMEVYLVLSHSRGKLSQVPLNTNSFLTVLPLLLSHLLLRTTPPVLEKNSPSKNPPNSSTIFSFILRNPNSHYHHLPRHLHRRIPHPSPCQRHIARLNFTDEGDFWALDHHLIMIMTLLIMIIKFPLLIISDLIPVQCCVLVVVFDSDLSDEKCKTKEGSS